LSGHEFDQAFADRMEADHARVISELNHALGALPASSRTRSLVSALLPTLRKHHDQAQTLVAELGPPSENNREPAQQSDRSSE
jgi:hypothetical protein